MKEKNRIAVLAGAGLAFDAGLPMSVQLVSNLKERLLELANSSEASKTALALKERASRWLELFRFLNGGIRFQEGLLNRDPDAPVNIEQIAIAAEGLQARAKNPLAPYASGWHQRLQELERVEPDLLKTFVDFVYSQLQSWLTLKQPDCSHYMARLSDFCDSENGVDIFTLNYDLAIEVALTKRRRALLTGSLKRGNGMRQNFRNRHRSDYSSSMAPWIGSKIRFTDFVRCSIRGTKKQKRSKEMRHGRSLSSARHTS